MDIHEEHESQAAIIEELVPDTSSGVLDISAVVCTWNSEDTIGPCLQSLRDNGVGEIILVDADSDDRTREIAKPLADKIVTDPRRGLAMARNTGIAEATKTYVINVGSDNIMPPGSLKTMLACMKTGGYSGVSAMTLLENADATYLSWAMNQYKIARYFPGERSVIGTPTLFPTRLLKEVPYDNSMSFSDDADLCTRLARGKHRFAISDAIAYESGREDMASVCARWKYYGQSDWEIYSKESPGWSWKRKLSSLTYPLRMELVKPFFGIPGKGRFKALPFLVLITAVRYRYWLYYALHGKRR